ncbi:MAG: hypothetical protein FD157_4138 [Rhodocyclaceae bacterium]|nr:MAG: hypothetical protein FD157_4138 [Rhodocyclaceae bacterium]
MREKARSSPAGLEVLRNPGRVVPARCADTEARRVSAGATSFNPDAHKNAPPVHPRSGQCPSKSIMPPKISATTMDAITAFAIGARIMREFVRAGAPNFN